MRSVYGTCALSETPRVAVITGGAQDIGRAVTDEFARRRLRAVISDINQAQAERTNSELRDAGMDAIASAGSVSNRSCMQRTAADALQRWGRLDILANCAGVPRPPWLANIPEEEWDFAVDVNLKDTFLARARLRGSHLASHPTEVSCLDLRESEPLQIGKSDADVTQAI